MQERAPTQHRLGSFRGLFIATACCTLWGCVSGDEQRSRVEAVEFIEISPSIEGQGKSPPIRLPPLPQSGWSEKALPDIITRPGLSDVLTNEHVAQPWATRFYRTRWQAPSTTDRFAIYIPRYHTTVGRLAVYVDGVLVQSDERQGWNSPFFAFFPPTSASSSGDTYEVVVALSLAPHGGGSLSTLQIGAADDLQSRYRIRRFLQISAPQIASSSFLLVGIFGVAFWWSRRHEITHALFAAIAAANFIRCLRYSFSDPAMLDGWFWWFVLNASAWLIVFGHFLAARINDRHYPRFNRVVIGGITLMSAATLAIPVLGMLPHTVAPFAYIGQYLLGIAVAVAMTHGAIKARRREGIMIVGAQLLIYAAGVHDGLIQNWGQGVERVYLIPYGSLILLATFLYAILRRYSTAIRDVEGMNASLETTLIERTHQLESTYAKLREVEREQAVSGERQRLMREMHDGLGSSLMSSLVLVEQGQVDRDGVAQVLREAIDDLKLTIDSLEPIGDDLPTVLGMLRYRLGRRLESAGIKLDWRVDELPALPSLNPTMALQILRMLQEALTNILKHAQAKSVRVETAAEADRLIVRVADDGKGFDVEGKIEAPTGRGISNMQRRARSIDAQVEIASSDRGTTVTISLPRTAARPENETSS